MVGKPSALVSLSEGVISSVDYRFPSRCVYKSQDVRSKIFSCALVNIPLILGGYLLDAYVFNPILNFTFTESSPIVNSILMAFFTFGYYLLYFGPLYIVSFTLCSFWYNDIWQFGSTEHSKGKRQIGSLPLSVRISSEIYRGLVLVIFVFQMSLCDFVPYIGQPIKLLHTSLVYSLYCFEYQWALKKWTILDIISHLEEQWIFYFGFGLPFSLCTFFWPNFMFNGGFLLLFPMFLLTSIPAASRTFECDTISLPLPLFYLSRKAILRVEAWLQSYLS